MINVLNFVIMIFHLNKMKRNKIKQGTCTLYYRIMEMMDFSKFIKNEMTKT